MTTIFLKILRIILMLGVPAAGSALALAAGVYLYLSPGLPAPETLRDVKLQVPLRIYSQDEQLIGEFGEQRRTPITFDQIPQPFIQALLAAEDDNFYNHDGVDPTGLLRAAWELAATGRIQSGGSTITMQLARNFFLSTEQSFIRKFNEILLALRIEDNFDKNEILTLYANKIYLGNRSYGIEAAAQVYYGKAIGELDLAQLAMIAGLPKAPSAYNPLANPERAKARRNWILSRMQRLGFIDEEAYRAARAAPVSASYHGPSTELDAPYIAEMARQEALERLGPAAYTDGYRVTTTVDSRLQRNAVRALRNGLLAYDWRHGYRGPEGHVEDEEQWLSALARTPVYGELMPAIVTAIDDKTVSVIIKGGETAELGEDSRIVGFRLYRTENRRSAPVDHPASIFEPGDLIRLAPKAEGWQLAQIPEAQAALVSLDPDNGAIRALVGGFDFDLSHFNRATQAERQPGSNFKPFIYTRALESGMTPATIVNDAPVVFDDPFLEKAWRPENDSGKFYGPTRLRKGLYLSRNLVSIRILREMGVNRAIEGMGRFGFDQDNLPRNLSLALGTHATTPAKIVTGYATFANGGYKVDSFLLERIETDDGETVFEAVPAVVCRDCDRKPAPEPTDVEEAANLDALFADNDSLEIQVEPRRLQPVPADQVLDPRVAYIMDSMLKDVITKGTGRRARKLERSDIAGKTGTTNGPRDAWFSGYSPHLATTVWVGFDQNTPLGRGEYGGSAALPIWIEFMAAALKGKPEIHRSQPSGLVTARIDPETGKRVGPGHPDAVFELFLRENVPPFAVSTNESKNGGEPALPEELF